MGDCGSFLVGDLVVFRTDASSFREGHILWVAPDYETSSLDVQTVVKFSEPMLILSIDERSNNVLVMVGGVTGWTKTNVIMRVVDGDS
jgi:hypothetical protein